MSYPQADPLTGVFFHYKLRVMPRSRIPKSLMKYRNDLIEQVNNTHRFSMEEIGIMFRLGTTQVFDIIKAMKKKNEK